LDHNNSQYWVKAVLNIRSRQFSIMDQDNSQYWIKTTLNIGLRQFSILDQDNSQYWIKTILNTESKQLSILGQEHLWYWIKTIVKFVILSFFLFSFDHYIICPLHYSFWLYLWYLQTFLFQYDIPAVIYYKFTHDHKREGVLWINLQAWQISPLYPVLLQSHTKLLHVWVHTPSCSHGLGVHL
jgi:hypothetical protein